MIELLAIPAWQTGPTTLDVWVARLGEHCGVPVAIEREPPQGAWIVLSALRLRGYALLAGPHVEAINFELQDPDPTKTTQWLEETAASLDWELHPDDGSDDDDDE